LLCMEEERTRDRDGEKTSRSSPVRGMYLQSPVPQSKNIRVRAEGGRRMTTSCLLALRDSGRMWAWESGVQA
jgi:hypothetical protein